MIGIKLNQSEFKRIIRAIRKLKRRIDFWIEADGGELNRRSAISYSQLVIRNIGKTYAAIPPYITKYAKWKRLYGWSGYPSPWKLRGDLIKNIVAFRGKKNWFGGINAFVMDAGGKSWHGKGAKGPKGKPKSIAMYGRTAEAKRPVFEPSMEEFAADGHQKLGDEVMVDIGRAWA